MSARDDHPALAHIEMHGLFNLHKQMAAALDEIDWLRARVAELEARPPHPAFMPFVVVDPTVNAIIVKTEIGWLHIGPQPPVQFEDPKDWAERVWRSFNDIGPFDFGSTGEAP